MSKVQTAPVPNDGVQYRKAKLWQIILVAFNAFNGMAVYFLIGLASYSASIGYGIATYFGMPALVRTSNSGFAWEQVFPMAVP